MYRVAPNFRRRMTNTVVGLVLLAATLVVLHGPFPTPVHAQGTITPPPAWLEPRMLSLADLVGFVPEETLRGAMITYSTATGVMFYESGARRYDEVEVNVRITPRYFTAGPTAYTELGCLGQTAVFDQWPAPTPAASMRLYANGQDITPAIDRLWVIPTGLVQPQHGSADYYRYQFHTGSSAALGVSPLAIPANMGCSITVPGRHTNLTATFVMRSTASIRPTYLGTQSFSASSYVGVGSTGVLGPLNEQMRNRYRIRHDKFTLIPPAGADYALVVYPPTPLDPYAAENPNNAGLEGSGTYRLEGPGALSVDHVNSLPVPLRGHWLDADYPPASEFLIFRQNWPRIASPEYFLPPGVAYDICMSSGGCPDSLLEMVWNARYPLNVHYFRIERIQGLDLYRVPLQQVGLTWTAPSADSAAAVQTDAAPPDAASQNFRIFMPFASNLSTRPMPPDDPTGCPYGCGWFDSIGRMLDFIPPP